MGKMALEPLPRFTCKLDNFEPTNLEVHDLDIDSISGISGATKWAMSV